MALIIRVGVWGVPHCNYSNKIPPNPTLTFKAPILDGLGGFGEFG